MRVTNAGSIYNPIHPKGASHWRSSTPNTLNNVFTVFMRTPDSNVTFKLTANPTGSHTFFFYLYTDM